jgi:hypothetical protein
MSPLLTTYANGSAQGYGAFFGAGAAAGDFESIATVTVGSGGASTIDFTSISGTYTHLQVRYIARNTDASGNNMFYQFNSDTANNYVRHVLYGDGSSAVADTNASSPSIAFASVANSSRLASTFAAGVIDILDYANTNKNKTTRSLTGREDNTNGIVLFASGLWRSTNAITSIQFTTSGNFAQYSHFALYGIKSA